MKVKVNVPTANREGRAIALELDTDTREVTVASPVMFRDPKVTLEQLEAALTQMRKTLDAHADA